MLSLQPTVDGSDIQEAKVETVETYCVWKSGIELALLAPGVWS
jgi:hypothetical protein